ncbi:MAG: M23 family metallopeptidase [Bacteroidales bacterium]|nr:M23 family metallopeptidase [Bacteroidales bacterium]
MLQFKKIIFKFLIFGYLFCGRSVVFIGLSQPANFDPPVRIPIFLSGNFGELRSDHFHMGIDIKTQGIVGKPIYAIERGYVSRVNVSSGGYGKALYVNHPNGYTSVYAHLNTYNDEINSFVKDEQYRLKSFKVNKYLEKNEILVEKGQIIGYTGNSGSSGGPHLHFEIRTIGDQVPQNGLKFRFPIKDTIPPIFKKLAVYHHNKENNRVVWEKELLTVFKQKSNTFGIAGGVVEVADVCSFGAEVYDYLNGSLNKCGVYSLDLIVDNQPVYGFTIDEISFDVSRYINSHMDYYEKKLNKRNVHKLYGEPNNNLPIYHVSHKKGILSFANGEMKNAEIVARDAYGNESVLRFKILPKKKNGNSTPKGLLFQHNLPNHYSNGYFSYSIEANALYTDTYVSYIRFDKGENDLAHWHRIGEETTPIHYKAKVKIKPVVDIPVHHQTKLLIAQKEIDDEMSYHKASYKEGYATAQIRSFGEFSVMIDTVPPKIKAGSFMGKKKYNANSKFSIILSDELSGIKDYNCYIDDEWALFEYDAKNDKLMYWIDEQKLESNKQHTLKIYATDECNNMSVFEDTFYF